MARISVPWVDVTRRVEQFRLTNRASLVLSVALVIGLSYPAWQALVPSGWFLMIDDVAAIMILEMDKCLQDGQLPCRWTPDLAYGYGGPFLWHHAPLPGYVGQLLHMTGLSILDSARYTFILGFLIAGLSMFLLAREFWGNLGGVVAATFYVYAPFLAMDVFVRGAQREQWGMALLPLVFWGIYKVVKEGKPHHLLLLTLFVGLLLLSHEGLPAIALPFALAWALVLLWRTGDYKRGLLVVLSGAWGLGLAAFFTLPRLLERHLHHDPVDTGLWDNYFDFHKHFVYWDQLFLSRFWGYGFSQPGPDDGFALHIGWLHWGVVAFSVLLAPLLWWKHRSAFWVWAVFFVIFWAAVLLTTDASVFVWEAVGFMKYLQFPWRFLAVVIFASSFLAGSVLLLTRDRPLTSVAIAAALLAGVIGLNQQFHDVGERFDISDEENFSGERLDYQTSRLGGTWAFFEYAQAPPEGPAQADVEVLEGPVNISNVESGSASLSFVTDAATAVRLRASIIDFPNWRVRVDGEVVEHDHDNPVGLITFVVPEGEHEVFLKLENTRVRTLADYFSLAAWTLFLIACIGWAFVALRRVVDSRAKRPSA